MEVQTATAIITSAVAFLVAVITCGQWVTNRARLKHELFDRRYKIYEKIAAFLSKIASAGCVQAGEDLQFLIDTKQAFFVFGCDVAIKDLVLEIFKHAADLYCLNAEMNSLTGGEHNSNIQEQRRIKNWFFNDSCGNCRLAV